MQQLKESFLILLFEFMGTLLLSSLWNTSYSVADFGSFLVGFFILLIFSARISGSHFNPAITLAFMFRRDIGRFSRLLGLFYIVAQYLGAWLGSQLSYNIFKCTRSIAVYGQSYGYPPISVLKGGEHGDVTLWIQAIIFEILGAMLLTFLYLTQTEEKTKLSGDPAITTMIISATYSALTFYSMSSGVVSGTPFNPAIAMGEFWAVLFGSDYNKELDANMWIFLFFAFGGALVAVVLFEFVYKKAMDQVQEVEDKDDSDIEDNNPEAQFLQKQED